MRKCWSMAIISLLFVTALASGCMYTKVQRPYDDNYDKTELGSKEGRSSFQSVLWLFAWGDAGTKTAAKNGGITEIKHADAEYYVLLGGLYARVTTVVYGD